MHANTQHNDEISFLELMKIFWQQRLTILTVMLACFCVSLGYLFYVKPVYEAHASVTLPFSMNLTKLNAAAYHDPQETILKKYSVADIYSLYTQELLSEQTKQRFFDQIYLPMDLSTTTSESKEAAYKVFLKTLKIKSDPLVRGNYIVSFSSSSPEKAQDLLGQYLKMTQAETIRELKEDVLTNIQVKLSYIKSEIEFIKLLSQKYNADLLSELKKSLDEATSEKLNHFIPYRSHGSHFEAFTLGTKILSARINDLKQQKINFSLMNNYRKLEVGFKFYSSVSASLDLDNQLPQLNYAVEISEFPISPKKNLILMLGLFLGLFVGCIVALAQQKFKNTYTTYYPVESV